MSVGIGDPVKVKFVQKGEGEVWVPATVIGCMEHGAVAVQFSDHSRQAVQSGRWRKT